MLRYLSSGEFWATIYYDSMVSLTRLTTMHLHICIRARTTRAFVRYTHNLRPHIVSSFLLHCINVWCCIIYYNIAIALNDECKLGAARVLNNKICALNGWPYVFIRTYFLAYFLQSSEQSLTIQHKIHGTSREANQKGKKLEQGTVDGVCIFQKNIQGIR